MTTKEQYDFMDWLAEEHPEVISTCSALREKGFDLLEVTTWAFNGGIGEKPQPVKK